MKARAEFAALAAASVFMTGCSIGSARETSSEDASRIVPSVTAQERSEIDFSFPDRLPRAVGERAVNVVSLTGLALNTQRAISLESFSGVRISPTSYLGPGHALVEQKGTPIQGINRCGAVRATVPTTRKVKQADGSLAPKTEVMPSRQYTDYDGVNGGPDVAQFEAAIGEKQAPFRGQPIDTAPPVIGDKLYFVNYQETKNELFNTVPTEYGGIVIGIEPSGEIEVAVGEKQYQNDKYLRGGASGGGVFLADGSLIGLSVAGTVDRDTKSHAKTTPARKFAESYGLKINGINSDTQLQLAIVQPLTKAVLHKLKTGLKNAPPCTLR